MIKTTFSASVAVMMTLCFYATHAQYWVPFGKPLLPGVIEVIEFDAVSNRLIAGTSGHGVFISSDDGMTWSPMNNGLTLPATVSDLAWDTNGVAYGIINQVIYSYKNGQWVELANASSYVSNALCIKADANGKILAATPESVYTVSSSGSDWVAVNGGLPSDGFQHNKLIKGLDGNVYLVNQIFVARWSAGSSSWTKLGTTGLYTNKYSQQVRTAAVDAAGTVYAGGDNGVLKYNAASTSWSAFNTGFPSFNTNPAGDTSYPLTVFDLSITPGGDLFACGADMATASWSGNVFKLTKGSTSWTAVIAGKGLPTNVSSYKRLCTTTKGTYAIGAGIFFTSDGGASWSARATGITAPDGVKAIDFLPDGRLVLAMTSGKIFLTDSTATQWSEITSNFESPQMGTIAVHPKGVIFASAGKTFSGMSATATGVYASYNSGASWSKLYDSDWGGDYRSIVTVAANGNVFGNGTFDAAPNGVSLHRSSDEGKTWQVYRINDGKPGAIFCGNANNKGYLFAGSESQGALRSVDNGATFQQVTPADAQGLTTLGANVIRIDVSPWQDVYFVCDYAKGVWRLPAADANNALVTPTAARLENFPGSNGAFEDASSIAFALPNKIFASTNKGIYASTDNGATWSNVTQNISHLTFSFLRMSRDGHLYVATSAGLFRTRVRVQPPHMSPDPVTQIEEKHVADISVFPNPSASTIEIKFNAPVDKPVRVTIFNSSGQQLKSRLLAGSVTEDLSNYAAGVYHVIVDMGDQQVIKQIVKQ